MNILYLHGFRSSVRTGKVAELQALFPKATVSAFPFRHEPQRDVAELREAISHDRPDALVATSLGGFYALCAARHLPVPMVLINPSLQPDITLRRELGALTIFDSGESFDWYTRHCDELHDLRQAMGPYESMLLPQVMVLLGELDDRVSPVETQQRLRQAGKMIEYAGQGHRFERLDVCAAALQQWLMP